MPLTYSTACEELAYSKDAPALRGAADEAIPTQDPADAAYQALWELAEKYAGHQVTWFNWWGDDYKTAVLYVGTEAEVVSRLRQLPERPQEA